MENMKFRTPNEEMPIAFIKALGAAPTPMSGNEVYTSLQNGTITATENGAEQIVNSAFYEVADNMTMTAHQYQTMHIMLSQMAKEKLSEEQLKAVQEAVDETVAEYDPLCQEQEATQEEFLRENINVYDIDLTEFYDAAGKKLMTTLTMSGVTELGKSLKNWLSEFPQLAFQCLFFDV